VQPRGQLWSQLEQVCNDFKELSGLPPKEALEILVAVLTNRPREQKGELERLASPGRARRGDTPAGGVTRR
jgi:hypothetical protein